MAQLFVLSGADVGRSFEVKNGDTLGRSTDCIVTLKDASISRRHAHIERMHNAWFIVDDRSRNGVSIDGVRVQRGELHDMSEFKVGELLLRFRASAPNEASAAPSASPPAAAPVIAAPVVTAPRAAPVDDDEIVLEGGDEEPPVSAPQPARSAPPPQAPRAPADLGATRPSPRPPPPKIELKSTMLDTSFGRGAAAGATISRSKAGAGDRILQYSKVENRGGLVNADLAQMSAVKRWTLYVVAFVIAAVLALVAFKGTAWVKALVVGDAANTAPEESDQ